MLICCRIGNNALYWIKRRLRFDSRLNKMKLCTRKYKSKDVPLTGVPGTAQGKLPSPSLPDTASIFSQLKKGVKFLKNLGSACMPTRERSLFIAMVTVGTPISKYECATTKLHFIFSIKTTFCWNKENLRKKIKVYENDYCFCLFYFSTYIFILSL